MKTARLLLIFALVQLAAAQYSQSGGKAAGTGGGYVQIGTGTTSILFSGDVTGTIAGPQTVIGILGHPLPTLSAGYPHWNGTAWVFDTPASMTWPASAGIPIYSGSSSWGTSLGVGTNNVVPVVVSGAWTTSNAPALSAANMTSFPTLNQSTTGNAATSTNMSTNGTANQVWAMDATGTTQGWVAAAPTSNNAILFSYCLGTVGTGNATEYAMAPNSATASQGLCAATVTQGADVGVPMPFACTAKNLYVHMLTAGAAAGSSVVKLYKNGVASALTCTGGTTKACSDTTHTASFAAGDVWSMTVTTGQATDTSAGVKAAFQCQ